MYILDFAQIPQNPLKRQVPTHEIRTLSRQTEDRGYFHHHGNFNVPPGVAGQERLVVRFTPTIYIAMELSSQEQAEVEAHEMDHFNDFRAAAADLRSYLSGAVAQAPWSELRTAWQWFNYYVREDARTLHINMGRHNIVMNMRPTGRAPY